MSAMGPLRAYALRRSMDGSVDDFPRDVLELQRYFAEPEPGQRIVLVVQGTAPGKDEGSAESIYILFQVVSQ